MTMPFYVSPEHLMKDRADFAQKGISRGRPVVAVAGRDGILLASHNPSKALHKISEIYDRIAFAAVGKYNEFETLRIAGIRYADLRGFSYDRTDVSARGLANAYAQTLGTVFTTEAKPLEVELIVAELGEDEPSDVIYRIAYDGSVSEIHGIAVVGGSGERDTTQWRRARASRKLSCGRWARFRVASPSRRHWSNSRWGYSIAVAIGAAPSGGYPQKN